MHVHIDCASAFVYMCLCEVWEALLSMEYMAINKPLDVCVDSLGNSMLLIL